MFHFCIPQTPFLLLLHIINECTNNETHLHQIHLGCCLKFLGCYGNGASFHNASNLFKLSYGTALNFVRKAISAILQLKEHVIKWPDCSEWVMIGKGYKMIYVPLHWSHWQNYFSFSFQTNSKQRKLFYKKIIFTL